MQEIKSYYLIYSTYCDGFVRITEKIEAASKEEAEQQAKSLMEKIKIEDKLAHDFILVEQTVVAKWKR